ncbi:ESPL1 protein, partial [Eudromia elegans]|nr:ESPL1 protein [Eudromia elegans]
LSSLLQIPLDSSKEQLRVKQLLYYSLQVFTNVAYSTFQCSQVKGWGGLEQFLGTCRRVVEWMLAALEGLPSSKQAEYLEVTASCTFKLAYIFYSQNLHQEVVSLSKLFCKKLESVDASQYVEIPPEKLHRCFRLQVESCWKQGRFEEALAAVVQWLTVLWDRAREQIAEPVSLWARVKADAAKKGTQEMQLWTLKDALKGCRPDTGTLVALLFEELKAYKSVRASTGRERYNVVCDLLELCSEESGCVHERATGLVELAQVLCYHDYAAHTDCSALDSIQEALHLLESIPRTAQNQEELLDDQAQALLWLYICTLEAKLKESMEREQRARAQGQKNLDDFEPNDLNYEDKLQEDKFLYDGIVFNLAAESAQSRSLDDAFALWKQLLEKRGVPRVRSPEQTVASLHIMAALYKLMSKPLQALESYLLVRSLCSALGDHLGTASALCQVTKLLFQLECPGYAKASAGRPHGAGRPRPRPQPSPCRASFQLFLEETESCLQKADSGSDSYLLLKQTCLLLRSQLCCTSRQVGEGLALLLAVLQNSALQKASKVWYLLRAHVLQLTATYLSLPPAHLLPELRQQLSALGWRTPETALTEAHKLFRSIVLLVMGSNVLGSQKAASDVQFVDYGDNVLHKWQVLADLLACSEQLVAALSRVEMVTEAKAFCLEAIKLAMKLHAARWCVAFLVLKAQLELQRSEPELSRCDLRQAQFLLESSTEFEGSEKQRGRKKILPCRGDEPEGSKRGPRGSEPPSEEDAFLKGPALEFVATVSGPGKAAALATSPELKPKQKRPLGFLSHPSSCSCCLCSELTLSALCLRWLLCSAQLELAGDGAAEGLRLLEATLQRCGAVAARFVTVLRDKLWGGLAPKEGQTLPALELLDDLVATGYATLASQSLVRCQAEEKLREHVEAGLTFLQSQRPHLPSLELARATLLLAKATAAIRALVPDCKGAVTSIFSSAWAWKPPATPVEPKASVALKALETDKALPQRTKSRKGTVTARRPKPKVKKSQRAKPVAAADSDDVFAVGDTDAEVPPIVIRPVTLPHTPHQKPGLPAKAAASRAPFRVFVDSSPSPAKSQLLKAPRARGRAKSRLKVAFSDDSDAEDPKPTAPQAARKAPSSSCKTSEPMGRSWRVTAPKSPVTVATGSRPTRMSSRRASGREEKREQATRRAPRRRAEEKRELMRTIEEEEKLEEKAEISPEVLRASEEEEEAPGRRRLEGADREREVLRQEATRGDVSVLPLPIQDPLHLGALSSALPRASEAASLDAACELLKAAFNCVSHCPPGALYSHLCQLLALAWGERDPEGTAYLVCEATSVTLRHQLLSLLHRNLHKAKKSALGVAERLRGLSLREESSAPCGHRQRHLARLQDLFAFSSSELGPRQRDGFREQLEQIPSGVTVCLMTLVSLQPAAVGDMLLLTRLERGSAPVTIRIPTGCSKAPLSSMLGEFEAIQREQKESISCTDHVEWWQRRLKLDQRMKVGEKLLVPAGTGHGSPGVPSDSVSPQGLIDALETQVLGCWKGALLPGSPEPSLAQEASGLSARLRRHGGARAAPALLEVVLKASTLLTPQDLQSLASGFCPAHPDVARILLQEALEKREAGAGQPGGSLVLVLDKHLQRLPWESMAFLRDVAVTRLPSLRFLLSYSLARERAGSVLRRGVNPASTFYILNPHNNLPGTEERFRGWFESEPGWSGVTGAVPRQEQIQAALSEHDLYIYAGHGAGARFLDGQLLARLECSAVALLFGCSSAALAVRGALEGSGIVLKYILAGWRWNSCRPPSRSSRWCRPSTWRPRTASPCCTRATRVR